MSDKYTITYKVDAENLDRAASAIALGQSVGNPDIRSSYEQSENIKKSAAEIVSISGDGTVVIDYKYHNLHSRYDIGQIMCTIQGGQSDIDYINGCRIVDIDFHEAPMRPNHPIVEHSRPMIGGIVKPKAGLNQAELAEIATQMFEGGVDFIKEDEILSDPDYLPLKDRVKLIEDIRAKYPNCIYAYCVNGNPDHLVEQLNVVRENGGKSVHINFWSGLGAYATSNEYGLFTHFQRSGIRILTDRRNPWGIDWEVLVKIAIQQGIDSIHVGMIGGYYPQDLQGEARAAAELCLANNVYPTLSCGMTPVEARKIQSILGNNWIANVGGWLHSSGTISDRVKELVDSFRV